METLPDNYQRNDDNNDNSDSNTWWGCSTNWTVTRGSLDSTVTFESSDSPIDDSEPVDQTLRSPIVLKPPSPDAGPCEIKICFRQKHEVLQVYVRSTARVYEIYHAPSLQSSNNYLCTVRCCIAVRDGELLHATDIREAAPAHSEMTNGQMTEEKSADEAYIGTNEDDWVEIKVPAPVLDGNSSLPNKTDANSGRSIQDLYEATAEITDSDSCMSLTLRLLSLQIKGCVYIDEIYVFGASVESTDLENQAAQVSNAAGSSLMSMLVPTLLQLSKSDLSRIRDKNSSGSSDKQEYLEMGSQTSNSAIITNKNPKAECFDTGDQQGAKRQEGDGGTEPELPKIQIPTEVSGGEKNDVSDVRYDVKYGQVEGVLEQLVSRVSRIEDLCLRFEENMLKPINSIETRLQRVEQQLEVLSKNAQHSGLQPCMRISAPPFPCSDSNSSSSYNDGFDFPPRRASELKEDCPSSSSYKSSHGVPIPTSTPQFLPTLVVSAPEFSCGDDEEENGVLEPLKDSPHEKPKQALSIDDALAAALAGFLSTSTVQAPKYTQALQVVAPDFTSDENGDGEHSEYAQTLAEASPECPGGGDGNDEPPNYAQTPEDMGTEFASKEIGNDVHSVETSGVDVLDLSCEEGSSFSSLATYGIFSPRANHDIAGEDNCQLTERTSRGECCNGPSNITRQCIADHTKDSFDIIVEGVMASTGDAAEEASDDALQNVYKSSRCSSVIDFEIPILDVKFASFGSSSNMSALEALLADVAIDTFEAPCHQENECVLIGIQESSILLNHGEPENHSTNNHLLLDWHCDAVEDATSNDDGGLRNPCPSSNQEIFASLI